MKKIVKILTITALTTAIADGAFAQDYDWIVRGRAIYVKPDIKSSVSTLGGNVGVSAARAPELDFTRFITKNVAAELILATTSHEISSRGGALGHNSRIGTVNLLPPTLTIQYHFNPEGGFRPYAGAGLNYTFFYNSKPQGAATSIKYNDNMGYALQAGFDYMIDQKFSVNFDIKKIYLKTKAQINDSYTAKLRLDPWVVGVGLGYRF